MTMLGISERNNPIDYKNLKIDLFNK